MKTLKYVNADGSLNVEVRTDIIGDNDNCTTLSFTHEVDGVQKIGLSDEAISAGFESIPLPTTLVELKAFATDNNYTLYIYDPTTVTAPSATNTLTALNVTTATLEAGIAGLAQVETVTFPTTANATQGDYIVLTNALSQETVALWLDIDADGTAPTGAAYLATDYQAKVSIVAEGTAANTGAAAKTAIDLITGWVDEVTVVDIEDGTMTFTQDYNGLCDEAVLKSTDDAGAGSITSSTGTEGTAGTAYEVELEAEGGNTSYVWETESTLPEGIELTPEGLLWGTPREVGTFGVILTVTDRFDITDTADSIDLVITAEE